ncbi:MAG: hypothetical protein PGN12_00950 [Sphingomonas phyllosphaerae]
MERVIRNNRLRVELAAARRASTMITDPLSMRVLVDYIAELEEQLYRGDATFVHVASSFAQTSSSRR